MNTARAHPGWLLAGWALLFLAATWAYWPGLRGPFLFDDFGSIEDLGDLGGVVDWHTFKAFVFGGHAGPTGRPLALLSFLIDGNNWPTDPWPFKRTNLVVHLINAGLLGLIAERLLRLTQFDVAKARWCALAVAAVWLLHPFLVSTTLYAVQRMAQLATLFVFLGLLGYLHGRAMLQSHPVKAYLIMSVSIAGGTLLSTISKENGILLPLLVGVAEWTVIASNKGRLGQLDRVWATAFIVLPSLAVFFYLGSFVARRGFFDIIVARDFSLYERLLTESRVLVDYLQHWFIPKLYTTGVFQDHFIKSEGLLSPATTLASALLHAALIGVGFFSRRRQPLLSFAILFFYAAHLLESTVLSLELYFEHRNYLAAAFLSLPLIVALQRVARPQAFAVVTVAVALMLTGFTRYSATIWSDYRSMVAASAAKAPTSARAQQQYAVDLFNAGRADEALAVVDRAIGNLPEKTELHLTKATMLCNTGALNAETFAEAARALSRNRYDVREFDFYTAFSRSVMGGRCPAVSANDLRVLFSGMLEVPSNSRPGSANFAQLKYLSGIVEAHLDNPAGAKAAFEDSLRSRPGASHAMQMAAVLASNDHFDEALHFSNRALEQLGTASKGAARVTRVTETDVREFQDNVRAAMAQSE